MQVQRNIIIMRIIYNWSVDLEMLLFFDKCLVLHYGLHYTHNNYNFRNYTLTNKNSFVDLGIVSSHDEDYGKCLASTVQKGPSVHWTMF